MCQPKLEFSWHSTHGGDRSDAVGEIPSNDNVSDGGLNGRVPKAFRIENPATHDVGTIDCASCHLVTRSHLSCTTGTTTSISEGARGSFDISRRSLRNFSLTDNVASVSFRAANESAEMAHFFNRVVFKMTVDQLAKRSR